LDVRYESNIFSTSYCQGEIKRGAEMHDEKAILDPAPILLFPAFSLDLSSFFVFPDPLEALQTLKL
jgi:hypothetical protein